MPRASDGSFTLTGTFAIANTVPRSPTINSYIDDLAIEMGDSVSRSGKGAWTANLSAGAHRLYNLGPGIALTDAVNLGQIRNNSLSVPSSVAGTADAITATFNPPFTAYTAGMSFWFTATAANTTTTPTVNVDGLGALVLKKQGGGALAIGDIPAAGYICECYYNGTDMILMNPAKSRDTLTLTGAYPQLTCAPAATDTWAGIILNAKGNGGSVIHGQRNGLDRWAIDLGNNAAESGGNAGSNFNIYRYNDAGTYIDTPVQIQRTGGVVLAPSLYVSGTIQATDRIYSGQRFLGAGDTILSNWSYGSNIYIRPSGQDNGYPTEFIVQSDGMLAGRGYKCKAGVNNTFRGNYFNIDWDGNPHLYIDGSYIGRFAFVSDYRIKREIENLPDMWERVKSLRPVKYKHKDYTPPERRITRDADGKVVEDKEPATEPLVKADEVERWGFVAHELQEKLIPDAATVARDAPGALQSPNPWTVIACLTKALQEAMARIEALEAKVA